MEHKTWLWRRKSLEKTITTNGKSDLSMKNQQEKARALELERSLGDLNEQLSSARSESNAKDDLIAKQAKVAEEAIAGWEKARAEAASFRQQLADALLQKATAEERIVDIDSALKECMQQLHMDKEEHQQSTNDCAMKISREQEKVRALEERLAEMNKTLVKLGVESSNLSRILEVKEKLIEELNNSRSQLEANVTAVMAKLDSSEKNNASLKYEVCMLQKELEIRNAEREFSLKSADAAHKQHLESIKKIAKLESECQRLRVMVRKRLPGPAALAKMRSEVEMLGNSTMETRRKKSNSVMEPIMSRDFIPENCNDVSNKSITSLVDRLHAIEDENKNLKESLIKKNRELQSSRTMFARTASKLSHVEKQLEELSEGQDCFELARSTPVSYNLPHASNSKVGGNEDNISCAESWASALISELEHFKNGKPTATPSSRSAGVSDLSLMDDFIEMEKLAIFCMDKPFGSSDIISGDNKSQTTSKETDAGLDISEAIGKELVPINSPSDFGDINKETQSTCISFDKNPSWLQDILRVIIQKHHITKRSLDVILEEVRVALGKRDLSVRGKCSDALYPSCTISQNPLHVSSYSSDGAFDMGTLTGETKGQLFQPNFKKTACKLIKLVEGITERSMKISNAQHALSGNSGGASSLHRSASLNGYVARAFLWKSSELSSVLQRFVIVCNELLHGKADLEKFVTEVTSTLDWVIDHCFSLQDVSNMKETIKKHFDGDGSPSDNEFEAVLNSPGTERDRADAHGELMIEKERSMPFLSASNDLYSLSQMQDFDTKLKDENERLRLEIIIMESRRKDLEEKLKTATAKNETLITRLHESEENISHLQVELAKLKEAKGLITDQIENQKLINEDLGRQLRVAKVDLNEARQKFSSLEVELEDKSHCCEELEATCLELQLHLEGVAAKGTPKYVVGSEEKQLRTDWEIAAASERLAECQETILNLGKQLKALASPRDAALFDKVIITPAAAESNHQPQLLDQMRTEVDTASEDPRSPKTKEIICTEPKYPPAATIENPNMGLLFGQKIHKDQSTNRIKDIIQHSPVKSPERFYSLDGPKKHKGEADRGMLAMVPSRKKNGVNLLRKLLSRRKKESSRKLALPASS
ncbi:filament-like plant protein 7 [Phoenix dactylifera]|uniref:Filament-like plant protein 7 n=1 Tax=Phoenix dactylifera TaxID=42345 RepID=A0A8B8ZNX5_PHODC|nr:filament-like plant protein 7 [Phoenix dactylifera]XP_038975038.1 filament-like plant protein 7 [Phoenix dactylifera]XP_038975039.1 filament-like plant protein 7 [Phoenix dactylifera]